MNAPPDGDPVDERDDPNIDPARVDPSGDVPAAREPDDEPHLGIFYVPADDEHILAGSIEDAVAIWREYHDHPPSESPLAIHTLCLPGDVIRRGDCEKF